MKKIKLVIFTCLVIIGLSVGAYTTYAALTYTDVQNIVTALGLDSSQTEILNTMVTGSVINGGTGLGSFLGSIGSVYSVTVDYSRTVDQLLTALNIPASGRDEEINLGVYSASTGTGQKNLDFTIVKGSDFLPPSTNKPSVTIAEIFSYMQTKGYRPATLQEFLTVAVRYPTLLNNNSVHQAIGSMVELPAFVFKGFLGFEYIDAAKAENLPTFKRYYKFYVPTVTAGKIKLEGFGPQVVNPPELSSPANTINTAQWGIASFFVVRDPQASAGTVKINELPSQTAKGNSDFYLALTGESYPVTVNYDRVVPGIIARDIPPGDMSVGVVATVASPPGTANINIVLGQVKGTSGLWGDMRMRNTIANSSFFSGYRFATARELSALNEQYKDQFDGVLAFGSYNFNCFGFPRIFKKGYNSSQARSTNGTTGGAGPTLYTDLKNLDLHTCGIPTEWVGDGKTHYPSELPNASQCIKTNAYDVQQWKFALVKINP